jgi:hypothetical protein
LNESAAVVDMVRCGELRVREKWEGEDRDGLLGTWENWESRRLRR